MRNILTFLLLIFLLFPSACRNAEQRKSEEGIIESRDLPSFLKTVELPVNFSIEFDETEVQSVDSAKIHKAIPLKFDENKVARELLQGEIVASDVYAEGPWFEAGNEEWKEYLTVYDGGNRFGTDSGVNGGINYSVDKDGVHLASKLSTIVSVTPGTPSGNVDPADALVRVGLDPNSKKHVSKYSLGMRHRLGIAQAIMERPQLLILDEPMNGLDKQGVLDMRNVFKELNREGATIILSSHYAEDIDALCDTVCEMDNGVIAQLDA